MRALGIDIGTTTISAVIVGISSGNTERTYTIRNDTFLETEYEWEKIQDPEVIITKAKKLLEEIFETYDDISVIGLTGQMHGILYIDKNGKHISPLYTWQDGRGNNPVFQGKTVCDILEMKCNIRTYTGYGLITHFYNSMTKQVPPNAIRICTIMDYLGMELTERKEPLVHISNAASLGLYDVENSCFKKEIFQKMEIDDSILPQTTDEIEIIGAYHDVPVCVAFGDNQASFMGSIRDAADSVLVNIGTGGQISVLSDLFFTTNEIETRPFVKNKYLLVGSSLCGGRAYAILESFFQQYANAIKVTNVDHYEVMEQLLKNRKENIEKLKVSTMFSGTRENPEKHGSIENIVIENWNPASLIYGFLEGMADELHNMYVEISAGTQMKKEKMVASGNGIRKNHFLQDIMSEKFSMSLQMAEQQEEAAYGSAIAGMIAIGSTSLAETMGINKGKQ